MWPLGIISERVIGMPRNTDRHRPESPVSSENIKGPRNVLSEKVGWVFGSTCVYREGGGAERSSGELGKFTIAGRVVDDGGNAVVDAELIVGKTMVYTGANGEFELTVRKRKAYAAAVEGRRVVSGVEIEAGVDH